jgi:hypothetical protein
LSTVDDVTTPPSPPPPTGTLSLPDSLLHVESPEQAVDACSLAGLRPIFIHAPTAEVGGCTCGHVHEKTASGSSSAGKHPIAKNWQSHLASREDLLDQLTRLKFVPNVGMVLGKQPAGPYLVAVDVDDAERFAKLEAELGPLPETPRCDSGRGYRLIFEMPHSIDTDTLVNVTGLGGEPGLDVKCKGGQIVIAPSMHASGRRYVWTKVGAVAKLPMTWALELVQDPKPPKWVEKFTAQTMAADRKATRRAERYLEVSVMRRSSQLAACGPGIRNTTLYRSAFAMYSLDAGLYLGGRWQQYIHDQLFNAARACGLPEKEVRASIASAEKGVRESGAAWVPAALQQPDRSLVPTTHSHDQLVDRAPAPEDDPWQLKPTSVLIRPIVRVTTELHSNVDSSVSALRTDDNLYQRDGRLVHTTRVTREESESSPHVETDDGIIHRQLVEGSPQIREMGVSTIRERLTKVAVFQKYVESSDRWKPILPTDAIVSAVHDRGQWSGIPPIVGIVETPTLRPGGTVVQDPGYDPQTGYLYIPNAKFPIVRDEDATQSQASWALKELLKVFVDFPYVNDSHRAVPIAAILTLVARPAIAGSVPAFLFDASTRGSGKTLQTDAIATTATGRGAPRMNYTTNEEELEKILGGYALKGAPFICLDNVPTMRPFGGGPLDRVLTARDKVDLRVLGRTEVQTLTWRAIVMATGNNMSLYGDTSRRVLMARLEPAEENPERRTKFVNEDLLAYVRTQRPRLVAASLLMLRAYFRAGAPNMGCERWGSFEEWSRLIPHAILFAGGADPMKARPERDEDVDVETQALACVLDQLPLLHTKLRELAPDSVGDIGIAARTIVAALYEQDPEWGEFEPLRDAVETLCKPKYGKAPSKPDAIQLGYKLRSMRSRVVGGRKLIGKPGDAHVTMWRVEKLAS